MSEAKTIEIEIFRPGRHVDRHGRAMTFGAEDVRAIAEAYDPERAPAPIVIGHPKHDDPAWGWVKGLKLREDGVLVAEAGDIAPEFAQMVREGRFRRVSASLFPPDHPANPRPGRLYLRHVGFLGAAAPAIPHLKPVELAGDDGEMLEIEMSIPFDLGVMLSRLSSVVAGMREWLIEKFGREEADRVIPNFEADSLRVLAGKLMAETGKDFSATEEDETMAGDEKTAAADAAAEELERLRQEKAALERRVAEFAAAEERRRRDEDEALVDRLVKDGRLAPGVRDELLAFMAGLDAEETIEFSADRKTTPRQWFRELLERQTGRVIDLAEHSAPDETPDGADPRALAEAALAYQAEKRRAGIEISIADAVAAVRKKGA